MSAEHLVARAKAVGVLVATAESCTGGLIAGAITDVAGSSAVLDRGFVAYSNAAKLQMLGVRPDTLEAYGAVSEETAREMAAGALARSDADWTISVTGIAGPGGGSADKPVGMVCFGFASVEGVETETQFFGAVSRAEVRALTVDFALNGLLDRL